MFLGTTSVSNLFSVGTLLLFVTRTSVTPSGVSCGTTWVVDERAAVGSGCMPASNKTADGVCGSLQDVLRAKFNSSSRSDSASSCTQVVIRPGRYVLQPVNISHSVVLRAESPHTVFIVGESKKPVTTRPVYTISFSGADLVQVEGIIFTSGPTVAVGIVNVKKVIVNNCVFRNFIQGALDIYNCLSVNVTSCVFEYNGPAAVVKPETFRGHGGGLSLAYSSLEVPPVFSVRDCNFTNNTADPSLGVQRTTSQAFQQSVFTGRGGGLAVLIHGVTPVDGIIEKCVFINNMARSFGGGLYTVQSSLSNHTIRVRDSLFIGNYAGTGAGGLLAGFFDGGDDRNSNKLIATRCTFVRNQSPHGGAIKSSIPITPSGDSTSLGNFARFENCTFRENIVPEFGAAIGIFSLNLFGFRELAKPMEIVDCVFIANRGGIGGTVSTAYFPLQLFGENTFINNSGPGLQVVGSSVSVQGTVHFTGNDAEHIHGGALYLQSFGQLQLRRGTQLIFKNNIGKYGASIVVESQRVTSVWSELIFNPLCPFLYEELQTPPNHWENVSITFTNNRAAVGSAIFMNHIDLCSWTQTQYPYFNTSAVFNWDFVHYGESELNMAHNSDPRNKQWYVQTPTRALIVTSANVTGYASEALSITLLATDELGKSTVGAFRLSDQLTDDNLLIDFRPTVFATDHVDEVITSSYFFNYLRSLSIEHTIDVTGILSVEEVTSNFNVVPEFCPPGYVLTGLPFSGALKRIHCSCDQNDTNIASCRGRQILLSRKLWGGLIKKFNILSIEDDISGLAVYPCPEGYCQCQDVEEDTCFYVYNSGSPDTQCMCNRKGVLCGECRNGSGVSALLNRCVTCSDAMGLLVAVLVIGDVVIFVIILTAIPLIPSWIIPCLFYVQVVPYLLENQPYTFNKVYPYLYYVSSALSFYFPYDFCLFNNMSALVSYTLRFIPLLVALIVCPLVLLIRHRVSKLRHTQCRLPWHGVWLIVLQLFPHVVYTASSILRCPLLPSDGELSPRWYVNGSIQCFTGAHIGVSLLAISALLLILVTTIFCFLVVMDVIKKTAHTRYIVPLTFGLNEKPKIWPVVELSRRLVIVLAVVAFPGNQYPVLFVVMVYLALYGYIQPFKDKAANIVEVFLAVDTMILLMFSNTPNLRDTRSPIIQLYQVDIDGCTQTESHGVTALVVLMTPFYYTPLATLLITVAVWIISWCWRHRPQRRTAANSREVEKRRKRLFTIPEIWANNPVTVSEVCISEGGDVTMTSSAKSSRQQISTTSDVYYLLDDDDDDNDT